MPQGTREAPILIGDDDDDDEVTFVGGPSRMLQWCSDDSLIVSVMESNKYQTTNIALPVYDVSDYPQRGAVEADILLMSSPSQPLFGEGGQLPSNSHTMTHSQCLKRKRSQEYGRDDSFSRPSPIPSNSGTPVLPDPFTGLSKKGRKRLRRRMKDEEEAKLLAQKPGPSQGPPRPQPALIHPLPAKPLDTTVPPNHGPLDRSKQDLSKCSGPTKDSAAREHSPGLSPARLRLVSHPPSTPPKPHPASIQLSSLLSKPVSDFSSNVFASSKRHIGKPTPPGSDHGRFAVPEEQFVPHDPSRTIVLENIPKKLRTIDFILQWCRDTSLPNDPPPLHVDVMRKNGKALVEFTTSRQACSAFHSPRMINEDGRCMISAYWFRPEYCPIPAVPTPIARPNNCSRASPSASFNNFSSKLDHLSTASTARASPTSLRLTPNLTPSRPIHDLKGVPSSSSTDHPPYGVSSNSGTTVQDNHSAQKNTKDRNQPCEDAEVEEGEVLDEGAKAGVQTHEQGETGGEISDDQTQEDRILIDTAPEQFPAEIEMQDIQAILQRKIEEHAKVPAANAPGRSSDSEIAVLGLVKDESHSREESPQLMYPSLEDSLSCSSPAQDSSVVPEFPANDYAIVASNEPLEGSGISSATVTLFTHDDLPTPTQEIVTPLTYSSDLMRGDMCQHSSSDQSAVDISVASERKVHSESNTSSTEKPFNSLNQFVPDAKLVQLRERVLASKKRRNAASEASTSSSGIPSSSSTTSIANALFENFATDSTVLSNSSNLLADSTDSPFFSTAISTSSTSSGEETALPKSTSFLNNMAVAFLESIIGSSESCLSTVRNSESSNRSFNDISMDPSTLLQKKQKRLEDHLAKSRTLLAQWETTSDKPEKAKIWLLIKEEKRAFEADTVALDVELERLEAMKKTTLTRLKMSSKKPYFSRWPQTRLDQLVFSVSDSEDEEDDNASESDE